MPLSPFNPRLVRGYFLVVATLCCTLPPAAAAAPYRPADDDVVLERLPDRPPVPPAGRAGLPPEVAAGLAQAYIQRARNSGDPRQLGYAQGLLQAWWKTAAAAVPDPVLLLRATLKQARHDFGGALEDLDGLLARSPDHAQGWLTRATVLRVQGRYPEALDACRKLQGLAEPFVERLCTAAIRGLHGEREVAARTLFELADAVNRQPANIAAWYYAERADLEVRAGRLQQAGLLYQHALQAHPGDLDLRAAHADLLLDREQAPAVLALIGPDVSADSLRLRRALALHALKDPRFEAEDAYLRDGFAAAHRRGEALHLREEARYALATGDDPQAALALAQGNWQVQREPADARLLIQAADAAGRPQAAAEVRAWLAESRLQDVRLETGS